MTTIGEAVSRIRAVLKASKEDTFLTDRNIYFAILKYSKTLIKREDNQNRLMRMSFLFNTLGYVELIDVDTIEAECVGIPSTCTIKRTKEKLPLILNGMYGPLFRNVSSIDISEELFKTEPRVYTNMTNTTNFKYNKKGYYWYLNGYLYVPNRDWEAIKVEAIFEESISGYTCSTEDDCKNRYEETLNIPEYLFAEVEQFVIKELSMMAQIPQDLNDDKTNILR
jgi:hypothetical protein